LKRPGNRRGDLEIIIIKCWEKGRKGIKELRNPPAAISRFLVFNGLEI
jgi:hypothetical protein